jgi:hypothetical protein
MRVLLFFSLELDEEDLLLRRADLSQKPIYDPPHRRGSGGGMEGAATKGGRWRERPVAWSPAARVVVKVAVLRF